MLGIRSTVWVAVAMLCLVAASAGAQSTCAALESRWGRGLTRGVAVAGERVFYGTGSELVAVDATSEVELGRLDVGGVIHAIAVAGDRAFLAGAKQGLVVVDVADPGLMQVLAQTGSPEAASGVDAAGDRVVVTDLWRDLWIYDVSDPASPQHLATFDVDSYPMAVVLLGDVAVTAEQTAGARVIDLSDPANPTQVALLDTPGDVAGLAAFGTTLYVADGNEGLKIVDISTPSNPTILGSLSLPGFSRAVALDGATAWVAADYGGYHAVDVGNPAAPVLLGSSDTTKGTPYVPAVSGTRVWMATWSQGVAVIDGSDPSSPQEVAWYSGAGEARAVAALGEHVVVADWSGLTLRVLDFSPASGPEQIGALELPGYVRHMEIASSKAYVALEWGDFAIVDLSDPTDPSLLGSVTLPGSPQSVALMGDYALVAADTEGLHVVDIRQAGSPSLAGSVAIPERAMGVSVAGTTAYVAAGSAGLVVVDVATPSSPQVLDTVDLGAVALHTNPAGDHVYVAAYYSGLFSVDVANPANAFVAGHVDLFGTARSSVVSGDLAFVGDGANGLVVVNVGDPANLAVHGATETPGSGWHGAFVGSNFVLADGDAGVAVFDVTACGQAPEPPHADFSYAPGEPRVGETVAFTDLTTGGPTGWSWWFSDDGGTSGEQNPTHVFTSAGAHQVRLVASNQNGSSTALRSVVVHPALGELPPVSFPFAETMVIPVSAHVGGAHGTAWVTDLVLHNPGTSQVTAYAFFLESETDSSEAEAVPIEIPANQSYLFEDAVRSVFGRSSGTGTVLIGSDQPVIVSSRTYNNSPEGTYGQSISGMPIRDALAPGELASVIQLAAGSFRSNLGAVNLTGEPIDVVAEIYSDAGQRLDTRVLRIPPWSHLQINAVFSQAGHPQIADGYAVMRCSDLNARWFAYASVVDNRSGDPVYVAPVEESSEALWISAAARVEGSNNTDWSTDLELFAATSPPNQVSVQWLSPSGGAPRSVDLDFTGSPAQRVADALTTLFNDEGAGALRLFADGGGLAATSRTFNNTGSATYGQYIPALSESRILVWGEVARLVQLAHSPDPDSGFRTNLGFVNTTATPMTVIVELRRWDSSVIGSLTVDLGRKQYRQINNVFGGMTNAELASPYAVVYSSTGGSAYIAYASVVDNLSGDPVFIQAVREP